MDVPSAALRPTRWTRGGNPRSGGFAGGKTFGVICQRERSFQSHSPSRVAAAKPLRGQGPRVLHGEAMPSKRWIAFRQRNDISWIAFRQRNDISTPHPGPLPQGERDLSEGCRGFGKPQTKTAALICGFYFYSPNTFSLKPKPYFPTPLHCSPPAAG